MSAIEKLEQRIAVLEAEVAAMKQQFTQEKEPWWKQWQGAFENDPYFEEAMKHGRKWRESQRAKPKKKRKPKK